MTIVQTVERDVNSLWRKLVAWWNSDAAPVLARDEQELLAILKPLFGQVETAALQDLVVFIKAMTTTSTTSKTLAEWETAVLNALSVMGGSLLATSKSLGSTLLQALIGLVLAWVEQATASKNSGSSAS